MARQNAVPERQHRTVIGPPRTAPRHRAQTRSSRPPRQARDQLVHGIIEQRVRANTGAARPARERVIALALSVSGGRRVRHFADAPRGRHTWLEDARIGIALRSLGCARNGIPVERGPVKALWRELTWRSRPVAPGVLGATKRRRRSRRRCRGEPGWSGACCRAVRVGGHVGGRLRSSLGRGRGSPVGRVPGAYLRHASWVT